VALRLYRRLCKSGYIEDYWQKDISVGADDEFREELVRQAVEVVAVELGIRPGLEVRF
jgi:hypothetical protein